VAHPPRKRFGQNFLHDPQIIAQIIAAFNPQAQQAIVEIGAGLGALTQPLLQRVSLPLQVIEIDRDCCAKLQQDHGEKLQIHQADVLHFDFKALSGGAHSLRLIGNLPYNISSPLLFHLLAQQQVIDDMVFMLQKEVVNRLVAKVGDAAYGRLSVIMAYYCQREKLFDVPASAFHPMPKVDSSVVYLRINRQLPKDFAHFNQVVTWAFAKRRKTLHNNLKQHYTAAQLAQANIDPQQRAEQLHLADFLRLAAI
jgi:16S rRNA (adenine1518-N6/adenine1519-N6)-dimethyltransferase